jgi:hypothetical protein
MTGTNIHFLFLVAVNVGISDEIHNIFTLFQKYEEILPTVIHGIRRFPLTRISLLASVENLLFG